MSRMPVLSHSWRISLPYNDVIEREWQSNCSYQFLSQCPQLRMQSSPTSTRQTSLLKCWCLRLWYILSANPGKNLPLSYQHPVGLRTSKGSSRTRLSSSLNTLHRTLSWFKWSKSNPRALLFTPPNNKESCKLDLACSQDILFSGTPHAHTVANYHV